MEYTGTSISESFTHEETKVQQSNLTCPNNGGLKEQRLVLNPDLLASSLRLSPLTLRKQELNLSFIFNHVSHFYTE